MKEIVIYLNTVSTSNENVSKKWLQQFTQSLQVSLEKFDVNVHSITNQKEAFFKSLGGNKIGCYLPVIDRFFINTESEQYNFRSIVEKIENQYQGQAFYLCLIEEVLPINHADYQPFYKFFNQGNTSQEHIGRVQEEYLPGNNNFASFKNHIERIAKEISYQLLKISSSRDSETKVFIGSTTSDLQEPVNSLYNFLLGQGIHVASPVKPIGLGTPYIEKKIKQIISRCWLSIHPYGNGSFSKDLFLPDNSNMIELENRITAQHYTFNKSNYLSEGDFKRIIWIPREASKSTYEGRTIDRIRTHSSMNGDAEIIDCSLDELKEIISSYYKETTSNEYNDSLTTEDQYDSGYYDDADDDSQKAVLVLYENAYEYILPELKEVLRSNGLQLVTLKDLETEGDFTTAKNNVLQNCKGVLLMASNWNTTWFKSNLNEVVKAKSIRETPFNFLCLMSKEIEHLPYNFANDLQLVKINGKLNSEMLKTLLHNSGRSII